MPRGRDTKVWNEDLALALESRYEMAVRNADRRQFMWRDGAQKIRAVRKDIYAFSTGRIVGLPENLKKTVDETCKAVIQGRTNILPDGYAEVRQGPEPQGNPFARHPYLKQIKARGGAYAILMAFHHSTTKTLSIDEICRRAQPYCDSDMEANFHAGRTHGAWKSHTTLVKHGLISKTAGGAQYVEAVGGFRGQKHYYTLMDDGKQFIQVLLEKFPQGAKAATAQGSAAVTAQAAASNNNTGRSFGGNRSPFRTPNIAQRPASAKVNRSRELAKGDGEKLLDWIMNGAQVGDTLDFKIGKARRKQLHDACDALEGDLPGLKLQHSSSYEADTSNRRVLTVRVIQMPSGYATDMTASAKRRPPDSVSSEPTTKRPRSNLPPAVAAAQAALKRQAEHEVRAETERKPVTSSNDFDEEDMKRAIKLSQETAQKASPPLRKDEAMNSSATAMDGDDKFDEEMKLALELSRTTTPKPAPSPNAEEVDRKQAAVDDFDNNDVKRAIELSKTTSRGSPSYQDLQAMERRSIEESVEMSRQTATTGTCNRALESDSSDSDDELLNYRPFGDRKQQPSTDTVARKQDVTVTAKRSLFGEKRDNEPIDLLSDDDDDSPTSYGREESTTFASNGSRADASSLVKEDAGKSRKSAPIAQQEVIDIDGESESDSDTEVIEILDDSQDSIVPFAAGTSHAKTQPGLRHQQLAILIDNRERNRNVTPRHLRMELTRLVTEGSLKSIWPRDLPTGSVEEHALAIGDFNFDVEDNSAGGRKRLPVAIERKRVSDLVQRSSSGDHWRQFLCMCDNCEHSVFLVETDTRAASRFTAFGSQEIEGWTPSSTLIDDEKSIFLFFARALLMSRTAKFIQTKDEISSLRAVAAMGVMAVSSEELRRKAAKAVPPVRNCDKRLVDRLTAGGIPWKLAREIANSFGSSRHLELLYKECASDECRSSLLAPFITENEYGGQEKTAAEWSNAIFQVIQTSFASSSTASTAAGSATRSEKRLVTIELSESKTNLFQTPTETSFYQLKLRKKNPLGLVLPTIIMQTTAGNHASHRLFVNLLPGKEMVSLITSRIHECNGDFVSVAKDVAKVINSQCHHQTMAKGKDRRVLLLCGLTPALDACAKKAGYMSETREVADLILAELMLTFDICVIQAVRLKGDTELILQLLSLACFHYHLLFQERDGR